MLTDALRIGSVGLGYLGHWRGVNLRRGPQKGKGSPNKLNTLRPLEKPGCLRASWGSQNPMTQRALELSLLEKFVLRKWSSADFNALEYLYTKQGRRAWRLHSSLIGATDT